MTAPPSEAPSTCQPAPSARFAALFAPSSLLASLVSPDAAAPLPLAPSALPRPLASRRCSRRLPSSLRSSVQTPPRHSRSLPQPCPVRSLRGAVRAVFPPRFARQSRRRRATPARSLSPAPSARFAALFAPSSLLASLVSPDDAAPLPLAPSGPPRPLASRRCSRRLPSSLRSSVQTTPRHSRSLPQGRPVRSLRGAVRAVFPPRCARQSRRRRAAPARSLRAAPSARFAALFAPSSLLAALVSPDAAAPLPLAPSGPPRPPASRRCSRRLPSPPRPSVQPTPRRSRSLAP